MTDLVVQPTDTPNKTPKNSKINCGLIMPISETPGYPSGHWLDVKRIISEALSDSYNVSLVSDRTDTGLIHSSIIQNLYACPICVCDVSSQNPNVLFELGMRLAFDLPVVIIKDDRTNITFDTSIILYEEYRHDLRHGAILDFKERLTSRVDATLKKRSEATNDEPFFLGHFKTIKPKTIPSESVGDNEYLLKRMEDLDNLVNRLGEISSSLATLPKERLRNSWKRGGASQLIDSFGFLAELNQSYEFASFSKKSAILNCAIQTLAHLSFSPELIRQVLLENFEKTRSTFFSDLLEDNNFRQLISLRNGAEFDLGDL